MHKCNSTLWIVLYTWNENWNCSCELDKALWKLFNHIGTLCNQPGKQKLHLVSLSCVSNCIEKPSECYSPLAFPATLWNMSQRRIQTVGVVRDVTAVTQQKSCLVTSLATTFTKSAIQATPALCQDDFVDLQRKQKPVTSLMNHTDLVLDSRPKMFLHMRTTLDMASMKNFSVVIWHHNKTKHKMTLSCFC